MPPVIKGPTKKLSVFGFLYCIQVSSFRYRMRSLGSAALDMALVASGSADVYYEWSIHCWDMAAGKLLVEEAGGVVKNTKGKC